MLDALAEAARARLEAFSREHAGSRAELFLSEGRRLTLEYEASTGAFTLNQGGSLLAAARVWQGERSGFATLPVSGPEELSRVLTAAARRMSAGPAVSPLGPPVPDASSPLSFPELSAQRARERAEHLLGTVIPPGRVVQAALFAQSAARTVLVRGDGGLAHGGSSREEAFVRCETSRGAIVDAVASPLGASWPLESLRARLAEGVEALEGPAEAVDVNLPLVLRPAVAVPLVEALLWLLRGDGGASLPALVRAVGKKPFPSVLSVQDDPLHPLGTQQLAIDDEGVPVRALRLIEEGRLLGFLHSVGTAARLGVEPNGRGLRLEGTPPAPGPVNFFVVPRGDALPERYTELVARVETFTTMPRPGMVSLVAGGWEVHAGRRVRRVAPVDLSLPMPETFRTLQGVGMDLTFFPTAGGCGAPTLVFPPLLRG
ncbi:TldE protein, part of TldE/TldD proteolytic complex [Archangium gephyra]|uniref:TldE protein, part of TldE/TldD proteolytic complex n=1 Tax=Archangium gephyra TaxID=48 RepID=A0AAC8Q6V3_9BACT|nr:TldE protein, part of TldE/TldD proteolytic complex [Archangium gephyra]